MFSEVASHRLQLPADVVNHQVIDLRARCLQAFDAPSASTVTDHVLGHLQRYLVREVLGV